MDDNRTSFVFIHNGKCIKEVSKSDCRFKPNITDTVAIGENTYKIIKYPPAKVSIFNNKKFYLAWN